MCQSNAITKERFYTCLQYSISENDLTLFIRYCLCFLLPLYFKCDERESDFKCVPENVVCEFDSHLLKIDDFLFRRSANKTKRGVGFHYSKRTVSILIVLLVFTKLLNVGLPYKVKKYKKGV